MATKVQRKQNPQLKERTLSDGRTSLYLEYYMGRTQTPRTSENGEPMYYESGKMAGRPMYVVKHIRKQEDLKLYLIAKPRTPEEREKNRQTQVLAENVRAQREQAMLQGEKGYSLNINKYANIFDFFSDYYNKYTQSDKRNILLSINRFKSFIREKHPEQVIKKSEQEIKKINEAWEAKHKGVNGKHEINPNEHYLFFLKPGQLSKRLIEEFVSFLVDNSKGSGAATAYRRFRKLINRALEDGIINTNPCKGVESPSNEVANIKDILSPEEMVLLAKTKYEGQNTEIRRAFIVSMYCGIRWCDIKELRYSNIDYSNSTLSFEQSKTKKHSSHSRVTIPLRPDLLQLLGRPEEYGKTKEDLIFTLPSHTMALKALRHWTARAGIDKHVTWHSGRHSFATQILTNGANIKVVAELLGHSGLRYVQEYTRAIDAAKVVAVSSLPEIVV